MLWFISGYVFKFKQIMVKMYYKESSTCITDISGFDTRFSAFYSANIIFLLGIMADGSITYTFWGVPPWSSG